MTFSIVARCPDSGALGIAISSAIPSVGSLCNYIESAVGAIATQSWVNPFLAINSLAQLRAGGAAAAALRSTLATDSGASLRQVGIVSNTGESGCWTGDDCVPWAGHLTGAGYAIQGNMLTGPEVLNSMCQAFLDHREQDLAERLLLTIEAGQRAGGDKRGRQSAALKVVRDQPYPWLDLRVDEHEDPIKELRRIYPIAVAQYLPFVASLPTTEQAGVVADPATMALLALSPAARVSPPPVQINERLLQALLGLNLSSTRLEEVIISWRPILAEIHKLRELDLSDVPPAVTFTPR